MGCTNSNQPDDVENPNQPGKVDAIDKITFDNKVQAEIFITDTELECATLNQKNENLRQKIETLKVKLNNRPKYFTHMKSNQWKPLYDIALKFRKADKDKSGLLNRDEFYKLCDTLDHDSKLIRLYSQQYQHTASSVFNNDLPGTWYNQGLIDSPQAWTAKYCNKNQWYQIDCNNTCFVGGFIIQTRSDREQYVESATLSYSTNGNEWIEIDGTFHFNYQENEITKNKQDKIIFSEPIYLRFVRLHPKTWFKHISLRMDLLLAPDYSVSHLTSALTISVGSSMAKQQDIHAHDLNYSNTSKPNDEIELTDEQERFFKQQSVLQSVGQSTATIIANEFSDQDKEKLFNIFDIKQSGKIDLSEFIATVEREAILNPLQHPHIIIKQTMYYLLELDQKALLPEKYNIHMLGDVDDKILFNDENKICCICFYDAAKYGLSRECDHGYCIPCLQDSLKYIIDNGKFPAQCPACAAEESMLPNATLSSEKKSMISQSVIRGLVEQNVIELQFGIRFDRQNNRFIRLNQHQK